MTDAAFEKYLWMVEQGYIDANNDGQFSNEEYTTGPGNTYDGGKESFNVSAPASKMHLQAPALSAPDITAPELHKPQILPDSEGFKPEAIDWDTRVSEMADPEAQSTIDGRYDPVWLSGQGADWSPLGDGINQAGTGDDDNLVGQDPSGFFLSPEVIAGLVPGVRDARTKIGELIDQGVIDPSTLPDRMLEQLASTMPDPDGTATLGDALKFAAGETAGIPDTEDHGPGATDQDVEDAKAILEDSGGIDTAPGWSVAENWEPSAEDTAWMEGHDTGALETWADEDGIIWHGLPGNKEESARVGEQNNVFDKLFDVGKDRIRNAGIDLGPVTISAGGVWDFIVNAGKDSNGTPIGATVAQEVMDGTSDKDGNPTGVVLDTEDPVPDPDTTVEPVTKIFDENGNELETIGDNGQFSIGPQPDGLLQGLPGGTGDVTSGPGVVDAGDDPTTDPTTHPDTDMDTNDGDIDVGVVIDIPTPGNEPDTDTDHSDTNDDHTCPPQVVIQPGNNGGGDNDDDNDGGDDVPDWLDSLQQTITSNAGDILAGGINFYGQQEAAEAYERSADKALDFQRHVYDTGRDDLLNERYIGDTAITGLPHGGGSLAGKMGRRLNADERLDLKNLNTESSARRRAGADPDAFGGFDNLRDFEGETGNWSDGLLTQDSAEYQDMRERYVRDAENRQKSGGRLNTQETADRTWLAELRATSERDAINRGRMSDKMMTRGYDRDTASGQRGQEATEQLSASQTKFNQLTTNRERAFKELFADEQSSFDNRVASNEQEMREREMYWQELMSGDLREWQKFFDVARLGSSAAAGSATAATNAADILGAKGEVGAAATAGKWGAIGNLFNPPKT